MEPQGQTSEVPGKLTWFYLYSFGFWNDLELKRHIITIIIITTTIISRNKKFKACWWEKEKAALPS